MKLITEEKINLLLEMVEDLRLPTKKAADLIGLTLREARFALRKRRKRERSRFFIIEPQELGLCPVCGGRTWLEEVPADYEAGYLIPIETGCFDILCQNGHRFQCDWREAQKKIRKEKEYGLQATTPARNNAGVSLRREETEQVAVTVVCTTEVGRGEMQMPHRRSWRGYTTQQRSERDNLDASYSGGTGMDEDKEGDRAGW